MDYFKKNKDLLLSYLYIVVSNILLFIFNNFYLKTIKNKEIVLLFLVVIVDYIIYKKFKSKFKVYLDLLVNIIVGFILMLLIGDELVYSYAIFSIYFANNIIFMKSRISEKFLMRSLQYLMILIYTILIMFIDLVILYFI